MNAVAGNRWHAELSLQFEPVAGRTALSRRRHTGPLRIQKPFYPEDGACHTYLLHPPGGVAGGDSLAIDVRACNGASVLLTTPGSTRIYRSAGLVSTVRQNLVVEPGASLEWLPQDTVLFGGSRLDQELCVELFRDSRFCGWEIVSMGRPASGDDYETGEYRQGLKLSIDGIPMLIERQQWSAGDELLTAYWGLSGYAVLGAFYAYPADEDLLHVARTFVGDTSSTVQASAVAAIDVTLVDGVLVARALANDAFALRQSFAQLWLHLRQRVTGLQPCAPRIWAT
jgi:urease accessory protein